MYQTCFSRQCILFCSKIRNIFFSDRVSRLVSVSKVSGLETLNFAKKWFIKISIIQRFFVCCICRKETTKTRRKNARNSKKFKSEVMTFKKNFQHDAQILKSRVSVSGFLMKSRSRSRLEILTRSRSRRLRSRPHH